MNFDNEPRKSDEIFLVLEESARETYQHDKVEDRRANSEDHGDYYGNYEPERTYIATVAALLHGTEIDLVSTEKHFRFNPHSIINNLLNYHNQQLLLEFSNFYQGVNYIIFWP